ncbi:glycosyltransferase family 2 protein [soil metagenome]
MAKLSAVIITFNEERNIDRCLQTLSSVADEIVVVDSGSTDRTEAICRDYKVRFIHQPFLGYIEQKNFATANAAYDLILSLDADEALSDELHQSVLLAKESPQASAYTLNRLTNYCGHWVRHCGWYPDKKLRLYDRRKGQWGGTNPHDRFEMKGSEPTLHLNGNLLHYSYNSISDHILQINRFSEIGAQALYAKGKKISILGIIVKTHARFIRNYIIKKGFLDGFYGWVISKNSAYATYLKYIRLYLLCRRKKQ